MYHNVVGLLIIIFVIFLDPEDGTHKDGVENSKLKIVLVCPSTRKTGIQVSKNVLNNFEKKKIIKKKIENFLEIYI